MKLALRQLALLCVMATMLSACSTESAPETTAVSTNSTPLKVLYKSSACGTHQDSQWLNDQDSYRSAFSALTRQMITDTAQPPSVNFESSGVLLVSMGQQRTGGYAVDLASQQLRIENNSAIVDIGWHEPKPGMMLTQALTNPCLIVDVPRGAYKTIKVIDQSKQVRVTLNVN